MDATTITFRPMTLADVGHVPIGHQGDAGEVTVRITELGSSAMLAFDGDQHVGQLQFRRFVPGLRSPAGLHDPQYWGDFGAHEPQLPDGSLVVFCFHVGQLDESDERDARYQGHGIGGRLLDALVAWADERQVPAIVAKAVPPCRPVAAYMGGLAAADYEARGFAALSSWIDDGLREVVAEQGLAPDGVELDDASRVSCCVRRRSATAW